MPGTSAPRAFTTPPRLTAKLLLIFRGIEGLDLDRVEHAGIEESASDPAVLRLDICHQRTHGSFICHVARRGNDGTGNGRGCRKRFKLGRAARGGNHTPATTHAFERQFAPDAGTRPRDPEKTVGGCLGPRNGHGISAG